MPERVTRIMCLIATACLSLAPLGAAAQAAIFDVTFPEGRAVHIAPGAGATLAMDVRNTSMIPGTSQIHGTYFAAPGALAEYTFVSQSDARCAAPALPLGTTGPLRFTIGPLAAGESLRCTWRVTRQATSSNDLMFGACSGNVHWFLCTQLIYIGSLPDMQLRATAAEPVAIGASSALVRITAHNPLGAAVTARSVTTECAEFGEPPFLGTSPFEIENDFPGACPSSERREMCFNFTGQYFDSRGFLVGPTPAGGEASCLLRLRLYEPLTQPVGLDFYFTDPEVSLIGGGLAFDPEPDNGVIRLTAAPTGTPTPLPLSATTAALLALLLAVAVAVRLRQSARN
jgi:hypothetical protein